MNAQHAIELSVNETRTVLLADPTDDDIATLEVECDDHQDGRDFWGTDENGNAWRVTI